LLIAGLLLWLAPVLYHQLVSSFHDIRQTLGARLDVYFEKYFEKYSETANQTDIRNRLKQFWDELETGAKESLSVGGILKPVAAGSMVALKNIAGGALAVVAAVGGALFIVIIAFYFLADMGAVPKVIRKLLPEQYRERVWDIMLRANDSVGGFLRGQLIACAIVGALASILLVFVGLREYAILIGFFAGLFNFIPYLGPVVGATPAILWALMSSQLTTWNARGLHVAYIVVGFILIQAVDGLVSQPFIVGKRASLHPLFVMLALAVGAQGGIGGVILAVPVACIVKVLWMELFWKKRSDPQDLPKPEARA
jgi:predicted PurR-regulated permease PerM